MFFLALLVANGLVRPGFADHDLAAKIEEVISAPRYRQARWGILVVDAETGNTVCERNADQLFIPASTTKLYSCAAALAALGADHRFETPIYRRGTLVDGKLAGDLILVAKGDPTLGGRTDAQGKMAFKDHDHIYATFIPGAELTDTDPLAGLKDLAGQVAKAGIREVTGQVLVDDRFFPKSRGTGSGPELLTPIVVNDNVIDIQVSPAAKVGGPAKLLIRPETPFFRIDARIDTIAEGKKPQIQVHSPGPQRIVIRGLIPLGSKPLVTIFPVDDPTALARALLIEALQKEGVKVAASSLESPRAGLPEPSAYADLPRVASYTSPPLSELIKVTLKVSHNLYASMLPILVAAQKGKGTLSEGLRLQGKFLTELGVPVDTICFAGGAGGANADAVTPRATVALLQAMAKRADYPAFLLGLPVLGVDGTLAEAVRPDSPARGKVRAKTGTLLWHDAMNDRPLLTSKAIAGTLTTAKGRTLAFAMFVNGVPLSKGVTPTREGKTLGQLCEILVEDGP
jgi:D-alanyl-D-alanine carboxypeptidase/D-alanyl-D-alanine-endopeptidase (penicillin-binding protein 4)